MRSFILQLETANFSSQAHSGRLMFKGSQIIEGGYRQERHFISSQCNRGLGNFHNQVLGCPHLAASVRYRSDFKIDNNH